MGKKSKRGGRRRKKQQHDTNPNRSDHIEVEGRVSQVYAGGQYEVDLDEGPAVKAEVSGRMRRYRIRVLLGDRVKVGLSPYDLSHGLITYRFKESSRNAA